MKILVTGGAGFIGSHIVDRYISLGHEVVVIDNLSTGREEFINPRAKFYKMDICDPKIKGIFLDERPGIVNHHAAQIDIRKSVSDPVYDAKVNIIGSLNIIQNSISVNAEKFIFVSSGGAVYGEPKELPVGETHSLAPESPYGVNKLYIENYLYALNTYSPLNYIAMRYANVYGPRQNPLGEAGVCAIFINRILNGEKCILYGNGTPVRDYVYIDDIADANALALEKDKQGVYNFGTGSGTQVKEIYQILKQILGNKSEPEYKPLRKGELKAIYLDCAKAKKELNWASKVSLKAGLEKTIEYFQKEKGSHLFN